MLENYLAMGLMNVLVLVILAVMVWQNDGIGWRRKAYFLWAVALTSVVVLTEMGTVLFEGGIMNARLFYIVLNVVGFSVTPVIPILLAPVFGDCKLRNVGWILLPCIGNAVLTLLSPLFGCIFSVSAGGVYQRGGMFASFIIAYVWGILVLLKAILDTGKRYGYRLQLKLQAMIWFIALGTTIQIIFPQMHTTWTAITMALALHYGFVCEYNDTHDALTGLYNRKSYEREIERLQKEKRFAVVVMDVDDFKNVNDRCGHPYGDQCLNKLASLIQQAFEKIGTCYRIGGDEFCVLSRTGEEDKIQDALSRLMRGIEACREQDPFLPVVSYGVRMSGEGESTVETIQAADRQMYFHKAQHKRETAL